MSQLEMYRQDDFPVFQNKMYESSDAAIKCARGDIRIVQDSKTGLVFNAAFDPELIVYDSTYQNEQGFSSAFDSHLEEIAGLVLEKMGSEDLIEVGCGKAKFLQKLRDRGATIKGFDPAYEGDDPSIIREYFSEELNMTGTGLILRHVLEHIENPVSFLQRLAKANGNKGLIYIEVPCLDWIVKNRAWFDIFYEHVNYFRLSDFRRIFGKVIHLGRSFGGQYLSVVADLSSVREPTITTNDVVTLPENFSPNFPPPSPSSQKEIVVWGGASKGVIFSLISKRAGLPVSRIIDINPAKQGKYLAATGLRVESPEAVLKDLKPGSVIYVMNPNYLAEIRQIGGSKFEYRLSHDQ